MKKYYLLGMKGIRDCNNRKVQLEYYLAENVRDFAKPVYGIRVIRYLKEELIREKEESWGISEDRGEVERLILKFMDNTVTPNTLPELVDEYITLRLAQCIEAG